MTIEPGVSVEQLLHALQRKNIPLPYEIGTFIALECCERIVGGNARVSQSDVFVSDEGDVMLDAAARAGSEEDACRALVEMLSELLVRSAPGVPTMLLTLVEQGPSDGEWSLKRLRDDLESSLVPLNRAATRRVLARLLREIRRDRSALRPQGAPVQRDLNQEIDSVLGGTPDLASDTEPGRLPSPEATEGGADDDEDDDEATLPRVELAVPADVDEELVELAQALEPEPARERAPEPEPEPEPDADDDVDASAGAAAPRAQALELRPSDVAGAAVRDFERLDDSGRSRVGLGIGAALLLLSVLMVGTYVGLGRDGMRRVLGMHVEAPAAAAPEAAPVAPEPPPKPKKRYGDLDVTSTPARAQVLLYVGTTPVEITGLPVGVAHELVALLEGHQPTRAVVPQNATWTEAGAELRYELAMEMTPGAKAEALGATQLPRDMGGPTGAQGTVRVESKPPGARIYQLVGFTPDVHVTNLSVEDEVGLLVYLKGHALEQVTVGTDRFLESEGKLRASIDVALTAAK